MTARHIGPPSWGPWQLEPLDLRLVNGSASLELDLKGLRSARELWQVACEALGSDAAGLDLLRALIVLFPPSVTGRPGGLRVPDIVALVVATCLRTRPVWHTREGLVRRMEVQP